MFKFALFLTALVLTLHKTNCSRILAIVPTASYSHQMFFQPLWRELAIQGHDIVVVTTDPTGEVLPNFKEVSIKEVYPMIQEALHMFFSESTVKVFLSNKMNEMFIPITDELLSLPQIQEIIHNKTEHFDLVMIEHLHPIVYAFKHRFNCPMIGLTSLDALSQSHQAVGNPVHSVLYPLSFFPFQENLTFVQRLAVTVLGNFFDYQRYRIIAQMNVVARKHFGADTPSIDQITDDTDMMFVNANPVFNPIRPHTPATISLAGGIHMKPQKPLPKDLQEFLDEGNNGIIYFSLGSNVKSKELADDLRQTIMDTFRGLPCKVLWKFEDDTLPGKPDNVKIIKWAPQQDVLRHKNVKLFITQAGLQSLEEALYSHVPIVTIPFFGDQESNAEKVKTKGLGVALDRNNLNKENFKEAILEVMDNPIYRNRVKELATQIQDQPMTPLKKALWWTEYVLRHKGAKHLHGPKIPFYQYYYLDVLAFLGVVGLVLIGLLIGIVKLILKGVRRVFGCHKAGIGKKVKKS